jgi:hypothetical protein
MYAAGAVSSVCMCDEHHPRVYGVDVLGKSVFVVANAVTTDVARVGVSFLINAVCALPSCLKEGSASEAEEGTCRCKSTPTPSPSHIHMHPHARIFTHSRTHACTHICDQCRSNHRLLLHVIRRGYRSCLCVYVRVGFPSCGTIYSYV